MGTLLFPRLENEHTFRVGNKVTSLRSVNFYGYVNDLHTKGHHDRKIRRERALLFMRGDNCQLAFFQY
jgi:hypothetical protein